MVKLIKLFNHQYIGFWILGLVLFAMQEIPYIIMPLLKLERNPIMDMQESSAVLNMCEKMLGTFCIVLMTFVVCDEKKFLSISEPRELLYFCISIGILLLNYFGWYLYFTGNQSVFVMMLFIVALPPLYYVFVGLWRNNILLTISGCIFLPVHFVHVLGNLRIS